MKQTKGFTLIELLVVVAIIGILAAGAINFFSGYSLTAKKNVAQANFMTIKNYILAEKARCYLDKTATVFQSEKCPITSSIKGASSGWCGVFGDFFLKKANFKNQFGEGSAYGVGMVLKMELPGAFYVRVALFVGATKKVIIS